MKLLFSHQQIVKHNVFFVVSCEFGMEVCEAIQETMELQCVDLKTQRHCIEGTWSWQNGQLQACLASTGWLRSWAKKPTPMGWASDNLKCPKGRPKAETNQQPVTAVSPKGCILNYRSSDNKCNYIVIPSTLTDVKSAHDILRDLPWQLLASAPLTNNLILLVLSCKNRGG